MLERNKTERERGERGMLDSNKAEREREREREREYAGVAYFQK